MFEIIPLQNYEKNLFNYLDDMERSFGNDMGQISKIKTDILDKGDEYFLQAELPGFDKDDIHIDVYKDYLQIQASHNEENESKNDDFVRRERHFGSFSRSFSINGIDKEKISARYDNGILEVRLPKTMQRDEKDRRHINIH